MGGSLTERLQALAGRELTAETWAQDAVNQPMIRHWAEAMGDRNPIHLDEDAARAAGRDGVVAPATMLQAWTMRGYAATVAGGPASPAAAELAALLEEGGLTSVVATDSELEFARELRLGDRISVTETVESVSPEKRTALGTGHFVTTVKTYRDQDGEVVGTQRWRLLRFRPERPAAPGTAEQPEPTAGTEAEPAAQAEPAVQPEPAEKPRPLRPRPATNRDNAFWFEACLEHRLLIQRCTACGTLRHPPGPCCGVCRSFDWDTVEASGRGEVYSFVVNHHPRVPAFDYPLVVAVVELAEGTRLIANLVDVEPDRIRIGMPVVLEWIDADPQLSLPAFRPAGTEKN
ncbi:hypothetical protein GQS52_25975 [Streptomyces sp. SCUT-3]|uniref:bifunctional MaoC family dehydratase N-terminal/OB-fold nucleic acid binding domain-containing protein n=1 Tax=Streptomyces TaxID=1883 RepID=UPI000CBBC3AE|nr:bifunctional MaoC family dehydratase N-terminal/OB-fold nucleic acid binding domain-containing protein [Streptomyces sp. SCUT-3]PLW65875.1 hypothetical protein C0036_25785 [Streptomyces sp. DJ]QMV24639.1 hypothetical protein GQS52_25975 [Streptomyces sp. SCUT-3]